MISANKKILALSITLALSTNTYAAPPETGNNKVSQDCPADLSILSTAEIDSLPTSCVRGEEKSWINEQAEWLAGLVAAVGLGAGFSGLGSHDSHHSNLPVKNADNSGDNDTDHSSDNDTDHSSDNDTDHSGDNDTDHNGDNDTDHSGDNDTDHSGDNDTDHSGDNDTDHSGDNDTDHSGDGDDKPVVHAVDVEIPGSLGSGQTGKFIDAKGGKLDVTVEGDSTIRGAASGVVVENVVDSTIESKGNLDVAEQGSTGLIVNGSNNTVNQQGNNTVSQGATGNKVTGAGNTLHQEGGSSVSGEGSTGSVMEGDSSVIAIDGELRVEDAATGAKISGQNGSVTVNGPVHVDNASGIVVQGDSGTVTVNGDADVRNGGTGIVIDGKNGTATNTGTMTVDGAGSTGVRITGDSATATQNGVMKVTNAATGFDIRGNAANVSTDLQVSVEDAVSTGLKMAGHEGTFSNTGDWQVYNQGKGAAISGSGNTVDLDGNINVIASQNKTDASVLDGATGITVDGDNNIANITGNINLSNDPLTEQITAVNANENNDVLTGMAVTGSGNHVVLDGALNGSFQDPQALLNTDSTSVAASESFLLRVSGDSNTVDIKGGVNINNTRFNLVGVRGINITGNNLVTLSGKSTLVTRASEGDSVPNYGASFVILDGGSQLVLTETSNIQVQQFRGTKSLSFSSTSLMYGAEGSLLTNNGVLDSTGSEMAVMLYGANNALFTNNGTIRGGNADYAGVSDGVASLLADQGSGTVINSATGLLQAYAGRIPSGPAYTTTGAPWMSSLTAMSGNGTSLNAGRIELTGPAFGIVSTGDGRSGDEGATNSGTITLNGYIGGVNPRDLPGFGADGDKGRLGGGVLGLRNVINTINTGDITVANSGFGMAALSGSVVTNQGTITLDVTPGVTDSHDQLYGMVATGGGTVVNGENGKIVITAAANALATDGSGPIARPFYKDGNANSRIVNIGQICLGDAACEDAATYNPTTPDVMSGSTDGEVLSAAGQTRDISNGLFISPARTASNAGTLTEGGITLSKNNTLNNETTGVINSTITTNGQGNTLHNQGTLGGEITLQGFADVLDIADTGKTTANLTVGNWGNLFNAGSINGAINIVKGNTVMRNTGSINGRLAIQDGSRVFNSGAINIPGNDQLWVDRGTLLVNQAGGTINTGIQANVNGTLYNQKGGRITAADKAGLWLNNASNSVLINSGDIVGGSAKEDMLIGLAQVNTTAWNTQDGVISFSAQRANSQVVNAGQNGALFINDGTINLTGKDASAVYIQRSTRSVNNGIINLGKTGDGSSGLIGMRLAQNATADAVIENNGTININANDSFAFGKDGANGRIINNGHVVIAEGVTGSGIIKQPGLEAEIEHDVHADFIRPSLPDTTPHPNVMVNGGKAGNVETFNDAITAIFPGGNGGTVINGKQGDMIFAGGNSFVGGGFLNLGSVSRFGVQGNTLFSLAGDDTTVVNDGTIANGNGGAIIMDSDHARASFWNSQTGILNYVATSSANAALKLRGAAGQIINDGTMNLSGAGAVGMSVESADGKAINNGTINLGTAGTSDSGMVAMRLAGNAGSKAVLENNGTINIFGNDSFAFSKEGANGRIINNGSVTIAEGITGAGIIKQPELASIIENGVHTDYTRPARPGGTQVKNVIEGYTIGTTASGYAGRLQASNAVLKDVTVDTGFTAGSAARAVTFNDVVTGKNIEGAENIRSESVVWSAKSGLNDRGNVDVTLTKNNYADAAQDGQVASVASALDKAYTSNSLFTSLNLKSAHELSRALRQISGSQATSAFNDARILTSRFDRLSGEAKDLGNGLAFNVISRDDKRAEMGNNVRYDMFALKQSFDLNDRQSVGLEYGMARLNGNGARQAGDNGLTGGYSQFMGIKHSLSFGEDYSWMNSLRYDRHELKSSRSISYGNTSRVANANNSQQYMELRTEGRKHITLAEGLSLTPSLGLKMRHTVNGALHERGAGDFNLALSSNTETAVDSVVGLKLDYAGKNGWSASASLEGGPNLSFSKSQRTGSLQGAKGVNFNLDDGQKGGGLNGVAELGVNYGKGNTLLSVNAFQWQEDTIKDKGLMMNYSLRF